MTSEEISKMETRSSSKKSPKNLDLKNSKELSDPVIETPSTRKTPIKTRRKKTQNEETEGKKLDFEEANQTPIKSRRSILKKTIETPSSTPKKKVKFSE